MKGYLQIAALLEKEDLGIFVVIRGHYGHVDGRPRI